MGFEIRRREHSVERVAEQAKAWLAKAVEFSAEDALPEPEPEPEPVRALVLAGPGWARRKVKPEERLPKAPEAEGNVFLYVVKSLHLFKVGYAANLYIRMSNLCVDNPHDPRMMAYREMPRAKAKHIERFVHIAFAEHCAAGEWFHVPDERIYAEVSKQDRLYDEFPIPTR